VHNNFAGLFYGLSFTKPNQDFTKMVRSKFLPDSKLLVVCQEGLRSTAAADALEREGFQNLACITSGLQTLKPGISIPQSKILCTIIGRRILPPAPSIDGRDPAVDEPTR
jgi:hypothetical protein